MTVTESEIILPTQEPFRLVPIDSNRSFLLCPKCPTDSAVEPYKHGDGSMGKYFKCITCNTILSESQIKHSSTTQPLGYRGQQYGSYSYTAVPWNRRIHKDSNNTFQNTEPPIPDWNGKEDVDLKHLLGSNGILLSCNDSGNEEEY